jgi:hypothetical protein
MGTSHTTFKRLFADVVTEKSNLGLNRNPLPHFLIPADHSSVAGDEKAGAGKEEYQCIRSTLQEGG